MIISYYYLDLFFLLKEFFLVFIVLFSTCLYTILEKRLVRLDIDKKTSLFNSVAIYFIILLSIYFLLIIYEIPIWLYLFNYSLTNFWDVSYSKIILLLLFIFLFHVGTFLKSKKYVPFEANYILVFTLIGMLFLFYSSDFLIIFLNLELQNFSLYILMNMQRNNKIVVETCIKYYIIGEFPQG